MAEVNNVFSKFWTDHDILGKGVIDQNEAYSLMQDISRQIWGLVEFKKYLRQINYLLLTFEKLT